METYTKTLRQCTNNVTLCVEYRDKKSFMPARKLYNHRPNGGYGKGELSLTIVLYPRKSFGIIEHLCILSKQFFKSFNVKNDIQIRIYIYLNLSPKIMHVP